jgi:hypothetical protein
MGIVRLVGGNSFRELVWGGRRLHCIRSCCPDLSDGALEMSALKIQGRNSTSELHPAHPAKTVDFRNSDGEIGFGKKKGTVCSELLLI